MSYYLFSSISPYIFLFISKITYLNFLSFISFNIIYIITSLLASFPLKHHTYNFSYISFIYTSILSHILFILYNNLSSYSSIFINIFFFDDLKL